MSQIDGDQALQQVLTRLGQTLERDALVQETLSSLRLLFDVDRVVLYYFYRRWKGQVTAESLRDQRLSIYGTTGADECFNDQYAEMYLAGRIKATSDITQAGLDPCHLEFLQSIRVQANLVAPILNRQGLWGLIVAHHCRAPREWSQRDIEAMAEAAHYLANSSTINPD
jgi:GAF domain-containing protein